MGNETDNMVKGVKVKRKPAAYDIGWVTACNNNNIEVDSVLTIKNNRNYQISLEGLSNHAHNAWGREYFEIVEEPETVDKPTELEELLKQIKTSIEVTEDARKAYHAAKAKSLELSKLLQQKLSNNSN